MSNHDEMNDLDWTQTDSEPDTDYMFVSDIEGDVSDIGIIVAVGVILIQQQCPLAVLIVLC